MATIPRPLLDYVFQLDDAAKGLQFRTFILTSKENRQGSQFVPPKLLDVLRLDGGIPVSNDHGFIITAFQDGLGDAVEVCAERRLDIAFEQRLEGSLDDLVAELEYGCDLVPQALRNTDFLWQVLIHTSGDVEMSGQPFCGELLQ